MAHPILDFEAPLLFDAPFRAPDFPAFLTRMNARLNPLGLRLHQSQAPIEGSYLFSGRDLHILISPAESPLAEEALEAALAAQVGETAAPDIDDSVKAHVAHIGVSVGDGPFRKTADLIELETKLGILETVKPADPRLKARVLHLAVLSLLETVAPTPVAIHWRLSDTLQSPDALAGLPDNAFPARLVFRPEPVSQGTEAAGEADNRWVAQGAERFCGLPVVLEASDLDEPRSVALVAALIERHVDGSIDLGQAGDVAIPQADSAKIGRGAADADFPDGYISVTAVPRGAEPETEADEDEYRHEDFVADDAETEPAPAEMALAETVLGETDPAEPAPAAGVMPRRVTPTSGFASLRAAARVAERVAEPVALAEGAAPLPLGTPAPRPPGGGATEPDAERARDEKKARYAAVAAANMPIPEPTGLARIYNSSPAEGMTRHILIALALVLISPLPGFILLIATLIRGPIPKLTFACAVIAFGGILLQATSLLSLNL